MAVPAHHLHCFGGSSTYKVSVCARCVGCADHKMRIILSDKDFKAGGGRFEHTLLNGNTIVRRILPSVIDSVQTSSINVGRVYEAAMFLHFFPHTTRAS